MTLKDKKKCELLLEGAIGFLLECKSHADINNRSLIAYGKISLSYQLELITYEEYNEWGNRLEEMTRQALNLIA